MTARTTPTLTGPKLTGPKLTGRHVLYAMIGFFGVILVVNVAFVYFAQSTFTGLDAPKAYRDGLQFNRTLADVEAQKQLGWQPKLHVDTAAEETVATLTLADAAGMPLQGLAVRATWRRPTQSADDREMAMAPAGPGRYAGRIALPARGQWDLSVVAEDDAGHRYRLDHRIWVAP